MTEMKEMTDSDLYKAAHKMREQGGGFASCIAEAYFRADGHNQRRLLAAFGDLFERFKPQGDSNENK